MRHIRPARTVLTLTGIAALALGLAACESEEANAHDDVFEAGSADMNDRLDAYAEEPAAEPADGPEAEPAPETAPEPGPVSQQPAAPEPTKP